MNIRTIGAHFLLSFIFISPVLATSHIVPGGGRNPVPGGGTNPPIQINIENPLSGANTVTEFIRLIISNIVLPIGGMVAVVYIMYAGFLLVTAQGNAEKIKEGRAAFFNAAIGTAILLGAWVIANVVATTICTLDRAACS